MKRRRKRRLRRLLLWAGLALLIAGFVVRRTLAPRAWQYLTHRPPDTANGFDVATPGREPPSAVISDSRPPAREAEKPNRPPVKESLDDSDRRALDAVVRRKSQ